MIVPVSAGVTVDSFTFPFLGRARTRPRSTCSALPWGGAVDLGDVGTVIGIVAVINVINLIDGVDGLAAGVCVISGVALAVIALSLDRNAAGVLAALTAGASLGFLRHGFPPASTFMGDTGSNLLGYLLGVVAVQGALKTNAVDRPLPAADHPHRADPRHRLRRRQAAQVRAADLPRRPLALPPPDGRTSASRSAARSPTSTAGPW